MHRLAIPAVFAVALGLAGCGYTTQDRALSGGALGAGAGAAIGELAGDEPLAGAIIGGALGAGTGALTSRRQVDLGQPLWR